MGWCFAIINNKLAEIYFEKRKGGIKFLGRCYIKEDEYKSMEEKKWIKKDISKMRFVYRGREYKRIKSII